MPVPLTASPPLTRSRTLEQLELIGSSDSALVLEGGDVSFNASIPARSLLSEMHQIYPSAGEEGMPRLVGDLPASNAAASHARTNSPSVWKVERRKRFRRLEQCHAGCSSLQVGESAGLFDIIDDEVIVEIMHRLVALPENLQPGLGMHKYVMRGAQDLRSVLLTCRRMPYALANTGAPLRTEMAARAATQIAPPPETLGITRFPFTLQVRDETRSAEQLRSLREGIDGMAIHCAGPCCERARRDFNRKKQRLCAVTRRSTIVAPSSSGECAFVCSRWRNDSRGAKQRMHNRGPSEVIDAFAEYVIRMTIGEDGCVEESCLPLNDLDQYSAPQSMRTSHCGHSAALIRAVHASHADESIPHSVVCVMDACAESEPELSDIVEPPEEAQEIGAINAQDAWWVEKTGDAEDTRLAVLWSTAYVHPMGSVVGANADNACYFIAVYNKADYELHEYSGPFNGKAQTASPAADGKEVAVLVRKAPMGNAPGILATRCTMLHDVYSETATEITHTSTIATGRGLAPPHPLDLASCPSAVGLSPSGDCVVAIHRRALTVLVEVLIRTAPQVFVSVQTIDVTHWISLGSPEPTIWDWDTHADTAHALKLPYKISFSPCGRFAALVDQRPLFGLSISNYAVVVLDMAYRHERRGVRACALAPVEDMAPRSIEWTEKGLWVQARYGALFLSG